MLIRNHTGALCLVATTLITMMWETVQHTTKATTMTTKLRVPTLKTMILNRWRLHPLVSSRNKLLLTLSRLMCRGYQSMPIARCTKCTMYVVRRQTRSGVCATIPRSARIASTTSLTSKVREALEEEVAVEVRSTRMDDLPLLSKRFCDCR